MKRDRAYIEYLRNAPPDGYRAAFNAGWDAAKKVYQYPEPPRQSELFGVTPEELAALRRTQ